MSWYADTSGRTGFEQQSYTEDIFAKCCIDKRRQTPITNEIHVRSQGNERAHYVGRARISRDHKGRFTVLFRYIHVYTGCDEKPSNLACTAAGLYSRVVKCGTTINIADFGIRAPLEQLRHDPSLRIARREHERRFSFCIAVIALCVNAQQRIDSLALSI